MKKLSLRHHTHTSKRKTELSAEELENREYEEFLRLKEKFESEDYQDESYDDEEYDEYDEELETEEDYPQESVDADEDTPCLESSVEEEDADEWTDDEASEETSDEDSQDAELEPEEELSEEELALYEAAEAYYEAGCDGECDGCEHYDYCPAEEEADPDSEEVIAGMTKGDIKETAKSGVYLAKESAMAAKELKEAMDDIMGGLDFKSWFK